MVNQHSESASSAQMLQLQSSQPKSINLAHERTNYVRSFYLFRRSKERKRANKICPGRSSSEIVGASLAYLHRLQSSELCILHSHDHGFWLLQSQPFKKQLQHGTFPAVNSRPRMMISCEGLNAITPPAKVKARIDTLSSTMRGTGAALNACTLRCNHLVYLSPKIYRRSPNQTANDGLDS